MTDNVVDINDKLEISRLKSQLALLEHENSMLAKLIMKFKEERFISDARDLRQKETIRELEKLLLIADVTIIK